MQIFFLLRGQGVNGHAQRLQIIQFFRDARQTAAKVQADLSEKASAEARSIIENARTQAALDTQREKDALKGEFARLVAAATAQVTGKVLTEADHRAINEEAIKQL